MLLAIVETALDLMPFAELDSLEYTYDKLAHLFVAFANSYHLIRAHVYSASYAGFLHRVHHLEGYLQSVSLPLDVEDLRNRCFYTNDQ